MVDDEWRGLYPLRNIHGRVRVFSSSSKKIINALLTVRLHGVTVVRLWYFVAVAKTHLQIPNAGKLRE